MDPTNKNSDGLWPVVAVGAPSEIQQAPRKRPSSESDLVPKTKEISKKKFSPEQIENGKLKFEEGRLFEFGNRLKGFPQNRQKALLCYIQAAHNGNPDAYKALRDCKTAAEQRARGKALFNLGKAYEFGNTDGVSKDLPKALDFYRQAAIGGNKEARKACHDVLASMKINFELTELHADAGNVDAQLEMGLMYEKGAYPAPQSFSNAYKYYELAMMQQSEKAKLCMNLMLGSLDRDYDNLMQKADAESLRRLALIHQRISANPYATEAFQLYHKAADEHNDREAQNALGQMYLDGPCKRFHQPTALEYFTKAANQGHRMAHKIKTQLINGQIPLANGKTKPCVQQIEIMN